MLSAAPQQRDRADVALRDFLLRYPQSDKAAQARTLLINVQEGQRKELLELAQFYEKQGKEKAAGVYYFTLAKRFPDAMSKDGALKEKLSALLRKYPELKPLDAETAPEIIRAPLSVEPQAPVDSVVVPKAVSAEE
jgi:outer membrane protein assembly factor BamD (BamD/ComL family)